MASRLSCKVLERLSAGFFNTFSSRHNGRGIKGLANIALQSTGAMRWACTAAFFNPVSHELPARTPDVTGL